MRTEAFRAWRAAFAALMALGLGVSAAAEDVPLSYQVESRPFKKLRAGDTITFEVHTDPGCTAVADSMDIVLGEDELEFENVRANSLRGVRRGPPTQRLNTVMDVATAVGRLYVRVTTAVGGGAPIVPVDDACQAQKASMQRPDGAASLSCLDAEIPKWNGAAASWECAEDDAGPAYELACSQASAAVAAGLAQVACPAGDFATGGGYLLNPGSSTPTASRATLDLGGLPNGWECAGDLALDATCYAVCCAVQEDAGP